MIILIDVDGIIADFVGSLCRTLNMRGHGPIAPEDFTEWNLNSGVRTFDQKQALNAISVSPGFCSSLSWMPGAREMLAAFQADGHTRIALTAPWNAPTWEQERKDWLAGNVDAVVHCPTSFKQFFTGDVLVEDNRTTCLEWCERHPDKMAVLLNHPWNQGALPNNVVRVANHSEIVEIVRMV